MACAFQFCFTLDTEPDDLWADRPTLTFEHFHRLYEFHRRLRAAGARPVYLTTSEVAHSQEGLLALHRCLEDGGCEIGAHFHTWTREWPFPVPDLRDPGKHAMAHKLGQPTEEAMLAFTCNALRRAFHVQPASYRGGRWSLSPGSATSLRNCGIQVDSTVTPGITWQDRSHPLADGPDFRLAPRHPVSVSEVFGGPPDMDGPLEIPVGSAWFPSWAAGKPDVIQRYFKRLGRIGLRLGYRWLRPTYSSVEDMIATMKSLRNSGIPVWVFMIHSSEIAPCKPLPTEHDVRKFVDRCERVVGAAIELGAHPATLMEAGRAVRPVLSSAKG
jgi:hypothetical protein